MSWFWRTFSSHTSDFIQQRGFTRSFVMMQRTGVHDTAIRGTNQSVRITVLSPHRDDAAFSLGLAIGTWLEARHQVDVVNCFTKSEYSPFGDLGQVHANDRRTYVSALRQREDLRWSRSYSHPVRLIDLNLRDAPQRLQCTVEEVCATGVRQDDAAIEKIRESLKKRAPSALVLPLGIGNHVDHLTARIAAQERWSNSFPLAFYEDLPYAARTGGAETIEARQKEVMSGLEVSFASEQKDFAMAVNIKRAMALCYDSQIDNEVTEQIARFCERYGGRERLWVNQAWSDSGLGVPD